MGDPLEKATARPAPTLGEGCLSRYDLEQLDDEAGTGFPGAARLWRETHPGQPEDVAPPADQGDEQSTD